MNNFTAMMKETQIYPLESEYTANVFTNLVNTNQGNDTNAVQ